MKRWLVLSLLVLALVAAGFTARYWLAPLLQTIGAKSELIQGLQAALQIVLGVAAATIGFWGWFRQPKTQPEKPEASPPKPKRQQTIATDGGEGNVNIIGEKNTVVQAGTYIAKQEINETAPPADATALRHAYLSHLFEACRPLSLAGIDPKAASNAADARLNLDAV